MSPNLLRNIPSVNDLLESPPLRRLVDRLSHNVVVSTVRSVLDEVRNEVQHAATDLTLPSVTELAERVARRIADAELPPLRPVINATGILLHPSLGRAPLAQEAIRAAAEVAQDYTSAELDLATGEYCRPTAAVEALLQQLTGVEAALVVSSSAAATMLAVSALAGGREVLVSRGQLIETDDSSRLPDLIVASGAVLREVGTTNKTRPSDYLDAIGDKTGALLLVQASDFAMIGSAESVTLQQLVEIGRRRRIPLIHVVGSAGLLDLSPWGFPSDPVVPQSVHAGANLVVFSGDKLLGGPQCGILIGHRTWIERAEKHPTARAHCAGRLTLAALAATLRLYRDPDKARRAIPLLQLLTTSLENLENRAERLAPQLAVAATVASAEVVRTAANPLEGCLSSRQLPTCGIALIPKQGGAEGLAAALRLGTPPLVGIVQQDRLLLDLRSVLPRQDLDLVAAVVALSGPSLQQ